ARYPASAGQDGRGGGSPTSPASQASAAAATTAPIPITAVTRGASRCWDRSAGGGVVGHTRGPPVRRDVPPVTGSLRLRGVPGGEQVQRERGGPTELRGADALPGVRVEVLVAAAAADQVDGGPPQRRREGEVPVLDQAPPQQPVHVDPDRTPPVALRLQVRRAPVVAGQRYGHVRGQPEPG